MTRFVACVLCCLCAVLSARPCAAQHADTITVASWLRANAIPLRTVEPGDDLSDLEPLRSTLAGVRIVGLGEATHGAREIFQLKDRLIRFLVLKMGFRVLAMELDYVAVQRINDYVLGRGDDQDFILKPWDTDEVMSLFDWLRRFNASQPDSARVRVVGIDGQSRRQVSGALLAYLRRVAPERAVQAESLFSDTTFPGRLAPARNAMLQQGYVDLFLFMDLNGARLINASSPAEYAAMLEIARALVQPGRLYGNDVDNRQSLVLRDSYMAENFRRLVERSAKGTKFILWAHDGHVEVTDDLFPRLGQYLRRLYGDEYYALGITFDHGSFQAWDRALAQRGKYVLREYRVHAAPARSIEWYLAHTGLERFIVDFRAPRPPANVAAWLTTERDTRSIGAIFGIEGEPGSVGHKAPGLAFDGLAFLSSTTRAHPTRRMREAYAEERR